MIPMKKPGFLFFLFLGMICRAQAPSVQWQKTIGGTSPESNCIIRQTPDGGYITASSSFSSDGDISFHYGSCDVWLARLDSAGTIQWEKSYGGSLQDDVYSVSLTSDGGYIFSGITISPDGDVDSLHGIHSDAWVVKVDSAGAIEWEHTYGGSIYESANIVLQTNDGGYIFAAWTVSVDGQVGPNHGGDEIWVVKLDHLGNIQWKRVCGGANDEKPFGMVQTADGGYIVAGHSNSNNGDVSGHHGSLSFRDGWVFKLNASGVLQWQRSLGGSDEDFFQTVVATPDGGCLVGGYAKSSNGDLSGNHGGYDAWVGKLDSMGVLQWSKAYGGSNVDIVNTISLADNGTFVMGAITSSDDYDCSGHIGSTQYYDYWIVKADVSSGAIHWKRSYGGTLTDVPHAIVSTSDGGYIVSGISESVDHDVTYHYGASNTTDCWILKLQPDHTTGLETPTEKKDLSVYPNPADNKITIRTEHITMVSIRDPEGNTLVQTLVGSTGRIDVSSLAPGVYTLVADGSKTRQIQKLVIVR
jgi:hypothetical protein